MSKTAEKNDFPIWLPPAVVKEIRQGLRSPAFMITLVLFPVALSLLFIFGFITDQKGNPFFGAETITGIFWLIISLALVTVLPLRALQSIRGEIHSRTSDLLVLTKLTPWRIVWGKWCSFMAQCLLLICTLLPFAFVRYYYGSIDLVSDFYWAAILLTGCASLTAIAIWVSGTHIALRIPFMLGLLLISLMMLSIIMNSKYIIDADQAWYIFGIIIYLLLAAIPLFLILASRWLSLPSDNVSKRLRLCTLIYLLPCASFWFLYRDMDSEWIATYMVASGVFVAFVFILELTTPLSFLPPHVATGKSRLINSLKNIFLVPGFFSAAMFTLLFTVLITATGAIGITETAATEKIEHDRYIHALGYLFIFAMLWWYSLIVPAYFMISAQRKLKMATPLVYIGGIGLLMLAASVLRFMDRDLDYISLLLPWGTLTVQPMTIQRIAGTDVFAIEYIIIVCMLFALALLVAMWSIKPWKQNLKKAASLDYINRKG